MPVPKLLTKPTINYTQHSAISKKNWAINRAHLMPSLDISLDVTENLGQPLNLFITKFCTVSFQLWVVIFQYKS